MNYLKTFLPYLFGNKKGKSLEISIPKPIPWETLNFEETLIFHSFGNSLNHYVQSLDLLTLPKKDVYQLFNFLDFLSPSLSGSIKSAYSEEYTSYLVALGARALSINELQELLNFQNDKLTVFAILNKERKVPGLFLVRRADGHFETTICGDIWSIPVLGLSGRGLPFHHTNGCTPTGLFTLDSVMPEANNRHEFGKERRLIVNFIPKSLHESEITNRLPKSHREKSWWRPSVIGRELGRSLLRIHGTGRSNLNPFTLHFPLVPTSGCLATNEANLFSFKKFNDQRLLLDRLMEASNLPKCPENESKIHGLLYVVEFDDNLSALHFKTH
jgi:hypothetical protein